MFDLPNEIKCFHFSAERLQTLNIVCKNYKVHITNTSDSEITIRYYENRFRKLNIRETDTGLYLEEKMSITLYGLFRLIKLMTDNELEIAIPQSCHDMNISVESGVTGISVYGIRVNNIRLTSSSGQIHIQDIDIAKSLFAHSISNKVFCQLPGIAEDYNIDCRAERKDVQRPYYPVNMKADKKITLRSNMYVPQLFFTSEKQVNS